MAEFPDDFDEVGKADYLPSSYLSNSSGDASRSDADEDPRIQELKKQINAVLTKLKFTTTRYPDDWFYEDYAELYRFVNEYNFMVITKWLPYQYEKAKQDVLQKITAINLKRRDYLLNHYGVKALPND